MRLPRSSPALILAVLLSGAGGLAGCAAAPATTLPSADAAAAHLYRAKCAVCHRLRDPGEETADTWSQAVDTFGPKAHLTPDQREQIRAYLMANARPGAPAGGRTLARRELR